MKHFKTINDKVSTIKLKKTLFFYALCLLAMLPTYCLSQIQCNSQLSPFIHGMKSYQADSFVLLKDELASVKIIGYGEDTHGTSEFTLIAQQLMQYLANNHAFNLLILETGFGEGLYLNDYIQGKRDDIKNILDKHNSTWRYRTEEFVQLMQWLRKYNQTHQNKIKVYGSEMQYVLSDVNRLIEYLARAGSDFRLQGFEKHIWQPISEEQKRQYFMTYSRLKEHMLEKRQDLSSATSISEFKQAYHHVEVLGQFVTVINQNVNQRKSDLRDLYMAENIAWILNNSSPESKAMYWAHNVHVGDWISNGIVDVTGHHLKRFYGEKYFNIASDFGSGKFLAFPHDVSNADLQVIEFKNTDPNTFTNCLKQAGNPHAFLNLRKAKSNIDLKNYLQQPLKLMYGAGASEWGTQTETVNIGQAFDAILYVDKSTPINLLSE